MRRIKQSMCIIPCVSDVRQECSILMGCLVETMPILVSGDKEDHLTSAILSLDQVVDMGDIMLRVLTTCRHRVGVGQVVYLWVSEHCMND